MCILKVSICLKNTHVYSTQLFWDICFNYEIQYYNSAY